MAEYDMFTLAGNFPPGLNTADAPTDIGVDETPDGYGYDMAKDGRLKSGSIPSGTARIAKTNTITVGALSVPFLWHYNRSWNITNLTVSTASNLLRIGAPLYDAEYYPQRGGLIPFNEDAQTIVGIVPFGVDQMAVFKSTGMYVISNIADTRALFQKSPIIQEMFLSALANVSELDGNIYVSNTNGLFSYSGGAVTELSRKVRDDVTNFANIALTADQTKKRIIGTSKFVYEVESKKIFSYATSGFRFTSRQFRLPDWAPFDVDRVSFVVEHGDTDGGTITYQVKFEDEAWQDARKADVPYEQERFTVVDEGLADARSVHKFQIRLTALSSNIYLKEIRLDEQAFRQDSYVT